MPSIVSAVTKEPPLTVFAYAFRPFFLLGALYAALSVLLWAGYLLQFPAPIALPLTSQWHAHEMLYGFVPAAIAGFLLTAITNWTGTNPLSDARLAALVGLWLAGRAAVWCVGLLPYGLIALVDAAFLPVLAIYVGIVLWRAGSRRNLGIVLVLMALAAGNALMHAGVLRDAPALAAAGRDLGLDFITVLMAVIAGRITPAFGANWLRGQGRPAGPAPWPWLTPVAVGSIALMALGALLRAPEPAVASLALLAALANGLRLVFWAGWRVRREPLLWILHIGYAFLVLALAGRGLYLLGVITNPSLWYHALGVGAMGLLIVGVMTRVTAGHTGRPLVLFRGGLAIYLCVVAATALRLAMAAGWLDFTAGVALSSIAWAGGFLLFAALYGPALCRPRPDGRPG